MYGTVVNRMRMVSMGEGSRKKKKGLECLRQGGEDVLYLVFKPLETNFLCPIMINQ